MTGIEGCLISNKPPGYAGGRNTPHSARSYDAAYEANFRTLGITNCTHREVNGQLVPDCTFAKRPEGIYNSAPNPQGQSLPIRAHTSMESLQADIAKLGGALRQPTIGGQPWSVPEVHPEVRPGEKVGGPNPVLRERTTIVAREKA